MAIPGTCTNSDLLIKSKGIILESMSHRKTLIYGGIALKFYHLPEDYVRILDDSEEKWTEKIGVFHKLLNIEATDDIDFLITESDRNYVEVLGFEIQTMCRGVGKVECRILPAWHKDTKRLRVNGITVADFTIVTNEFLSCLIEHSSCGCLSCLIPPVSFLVLNCWRFLNRLWTCPPGDPLSSINGGSNFVKVKKTLKWLYQESHNSYKDAQLGDPFEFLIGSDEAKKMIFGGNIGFAILLSISGDSAFSIKKNKNGWIVSGLTVLSWNSVVSKEDTETNSELDLNHFETPETLPEFLITDSYNIYLPDCLTPINFCRVNDFSIMSWNMLLFETTTLFRQKSISKTELLRAQKCFWKAFESNSDQLFGNFVIPDPVFSRRVKNQNKPEKENLNKKTLEPNSLIKKIYNQNESSF